MSLILFEPMSWERFQVEYRDKIRVNIDWDGLVAVPPSVSMRIGAPANLCHPWYRDSKGAHPWRDGRLVPVRSGYKPALIRVPAARYGRTTVVLDGNHRIRAHCPQFLVLDVLGLCAKNKVYLSEFIR